MRRLEDDAEAPQRLAGRAADVVAEDADRAVARVVEMADQREQRCLAGTVEAEQDGEGPRRNRERDVVERPFTAVGMADRGDVERRDIVSRPACPRMLHGVIPIHVL
jgi:hypothetical protein